MAIKTVNRYSAFLYPGVRADEGRINLYCGDHKLYLIFRSDEAELPSNSFNSSNKIGVAYENFSRFPYYLDLIRNEKPISVTFNPDATPPVYVVFCASEPPGDGEI
jgi:hypothetical protein